MEIFFVHAAATDKVKVIADKCYPTSWNGKSTFARPSSHMDRIFFMAMFENELVCFQLPRALRKILHLQLLSIVSQL